MKTKSSVTKVISDLEKDIQQERQVILDFGKHTDPEKITKVLKYFDGRYDLEVNCRHAELEELIEAAVIGGVAGAAAGGLAAICFGGPIGLMVGAGVFVGSLIGFSSVTLQIKVYKYRGNTKMKLTPA